MKYMSEDLINQITLDCLLNKQMYGSHLRKKKVKKHNNEERKFYRKRFYWFSRLHSHCSNNRA